MNNCILAHATPHLLELAPENGNQVPKPCKDLKNVFHYNKPPS